MGELHNKSLLQAANYSGLKRHVSIISDYRGWRYNLILTIS